MRLHRQICPSPVTNLVQLSLDGVSEAKSNTISLDVYSLKFDNCRNIYPLTIVRPVQKSFVDNQLELEGFVKEVISQDIQITSFVADNPKRAIIRHARSHGAAYPCEYCNTKAVPCAGVTNPENSKIQKQVEKRKEMVEKSIQELAQVDIPNEQNLLDLTRYLQEIENDLKQIKKKKLVLFSLPLRHQVL